jgi:hypothetical protein
VCWGFPGPSQKTLRGVCLRCQSLLCSFQFKLCKWTLSMQRSSGLHLRAGNGAAHGAGSGVQLWGPGRGSAPHPSCVAFFLPNQPTCQPGGLQRGGIKAHTAVGLQERTPAAAPSSCPSHTPMKGGLADFLPQICPPLASGSRTAVFWQGEEGRGPIIILLLLGMPVICLCPHPVLPPPGSFPGLLLLSGLGK